MQKVSLKGIYKDLKILLIGNPGVGKSTLLNFFAGKQLTESGLSFGRSANNALHENELEGVTFIDTPGLSDDVLRKEAAEAITEALQKGGDFKIFFVCTLVRGLHDGGARPEDKALMQLVLGALKDAVPNMQYGIIFNQVPPKVYSILQEDKNQAYTKTIKALNQALPTQTQWVHLEEMQPKAQDEDNVLMQLSSKLNGFLSMTPAIHVDGSKVDVVEPDMFEKIRAEAELQIKQMHEINEALQQELEKNKEATEKMRADMEERAKQRQEDMEKQKEESKKMAILAQQAQEQAQAMAEHAKKAAKKHKKESKHARSRSRSAS